MPGGGLIIAAPASGSGKTVVTLAILRALTRAGVRVQSFKVGPDYIDPAFHAAATGRPCFNLDAWAMRPATVTDLLGRLNVDAELIVGEGVMGLFDGASDGTGSTADVAAMTGWPVILVVDVRGQAASVAALLRGFASHRGDVPVVGAIFNRVGGDGACGDLAPRRGAARPAGPGLPAARRVTEVAASGTLAWFRRASCADLPAFLEAAADVAGRCLDLGQLRSLSAHGASARLGRVQPWQRGVAAAWSADRGGARSADATALPAVNPRGRLLRLSLPDVGTVDRHSPKTDDTARAQLRLDVQNFKTALQRQSPHARRSEISPCGNRLPTDDRTVIIIRRRRQSAATPSTQHPDRRSTGRTDRDRRQLPQKSRARPGAVAANEGRVDAGHSERTRTAARERLAVTSSRCQARRCREMPPKRPSRQPAEPDQIGTAVRQ